MCFIFLYLLIPRLNLPVHSPCENTHCFLCRVYTDKYEANVEGYNAPISCVLSLCQVLTWVLMNSLNSYTTQEKSVALLNYHSVHMEHSRLPCLHPLSTSTVYIPVYIHWGASSWPTAPIARILDASIHSPKTDLHLSFYSMEKIILKKQPWYKTDKNNSSLKMSNLDTIQCGCNSRHSNEHSGGLTSEEVAHLLDLDKQLLLTQEPWGYFWNPEAGNRLFPY